MQLGSSIHSMNPHQPLEISLSFICWIVSISQRFLAWDLSMKLFKFIEVLNNPTKRLMGWLPLAPILDFCSENPLLAVPREAPFARESSTSTNGRHSASSRNSIQPRPQIGLFRMKGTGLQFSHLPVYKWKFAPYVTSSKDSQVMWELRFFNQRSNCVSARNLYKE